MSIQSNEERIDPVKGKRMIERIIRFEKRNIKTRQHQDKDVIKKIKEIIREEADAYVN